MSELSEFLSCMLWSKLPNLWSCQGLGVLLGPSALRLPSHLAGEQTGELRSGGVESGMAGQQGSYATGQQSGYTPGQLDVGQAGFPSSQDSGLSTGEKAGIGAGAGAGLVAGAAGARELHNRSDDNDRNLEVRPLCRQRRVVCKIYNAHQCSLTDAVCLRDCFRHQLSL